MGTEGRELNLRSLLEYVMASEIIPEILRQSSLYFLVKRYLFSNCCIFQEKGGA
jgi:hypothetical protein